MIDGRGDPNGAEFADAVQALFRVAYAVTAVRRATDVDYGVMPLEGVWWAHDLSLFARGERSAWQWTLMILQPDVVTAAVLEDALAKLAARKAPGRSSGCASASTTRGRPCSSCTSARSRPRRLTSSGCTRSSRPTEGYERAGKHHELYLSNPGRTAPEKLRTILRSPSPRRLL